jgi:DNA-binding MarR family transcriptional regulator
MGQLVALMEAWEQYQETAPKGNLEGFRQWLNKKHQRPEVPAQDVFRADDSGFNKFDEGKRASMQASYLIGKLYQYLLIYTKPLMKKWGLHSMDDFGYLATVQWHGTISKSRACQAMLQEITTGTDIIKRLIRLGYLKELIDKADRRQRILRLTAKGEKALSALQVDFLSLPDVLGELDSNSRSTLVTWLMSLDAYHDNIVKKTRTL